MRFYAFLAALLMLLTGGARSHAGGVLTQGQLNTELGTSCAAQGKTAPCIGPAQMSDLIATAVPAVATGISAAGTTQGTATALTGQINDVATVAAGTGVALPTAVAGQQDTVCNDGANALLIYPASGASIGSNAANSPVGADPGQCLSLVALTSTAWRIIGGNPGSTLAAGFYVSPGGSDSNPGTLAAPFQTLGAVPDRHAQRIQNLLCAGRHLRAPVRRPFAYRVGRRRDLPILSARWPPDSNPQRRIAGRQHPISADSDRRHGGHDQWPRVQKQHDVHRRLYPRRRVGIHQQPHRRRRREPVVRPRHLRQ